MTTTRTAALLVSIAVLATPHPALACAGGFFSFTNTLCPARMLVRVCLGDQGNNLLFALRKGESIYFQTSPNSSYSWSCNGEPAAVCPTAYCVNGP